MKKRGLSLAVFVVALLASSGASPQPQGGSPSARLAVAEEPFQRQLIEDVRESLRTRARARTPVEWQESGSTPADIFKNARALHAPEVPAALCKALGDLPDPDLALFGDEIESPVNREVLPCAEELAERVRNYWNVAKVRLDHERLMEGLRAPSPVPGETVERLPSLEVHVDVARTGSLRRGGLKDGQIAITLDDGPHPTRTLRVLEILRSAGVRSNFFEVGRNAAEWPRISEQVSAEGHVVGSHTWDHADLPRIDLARAEHEIVSGRTAVSAATGVAVPFFRFPYGDTTPVLQDFVRQQGLASFFWNMDSQDWKITDPSELLEHVKSELDRAKGGIILFHDIHEQTVIVLPHVLEELRARNFTTVLFVPHG